MEGLGLPQALLRELTEILTPAHLLTDPDMTESYSVDWTGRFKGQARAVARPGATAEVAAAVVACRREGVAIVPQGGNTGLVGGSVPLDGELVLSLRRLSELGAVDGTSGQVTAGAGVTLGDLQRAAEQAGWAYGVDLAARDSATVGGTVGTNAGGLQVLRHGGTRRQLLGIEAVLGNGSLVSHLNGLERDNTGYDLAGLLCGSEGTLGVVTAARLRLVEALHERVTALLSFASPAAAARAAAELRRGVSSVESIELVLDEGVALVCAHLGLPPPFATPSPAYLLVECAGESDPTGDLAGAVESLADLGEAAVATDSSRRAELWRYREAHTEAISRLGTPIKMDVAVAPGRLAELVVEAPGVVAAVVARARTFLFGHAGDGNLHVNVIGALARAEEVEDAFYRLVASLSGSISAEHGIGRAKRRWLALCRSESELAAFSAVKSALDPDGIMNPGVLLG